MEKVYISGPITGYKNNNKESFTNAEYRLKQKGYEVINPLDVCASLPSDTIYTEYMRFDIRALTFCDSIYMLKGWKKSKGANIELTVAQVIGLKVLYE
jgi:hypothetical protein